MKKNLSDVVTIVDVAREAGVSIATVSRVINNVDSVKAPTRQKVLNAMMRLGYVANNQARSLRGARSQVIGFLVPDVGNSYIGSIIRGIDAELVARQYDMLLYTTHRHKLNEAAHVTTIMRGLADGLLLLLPTNVEAYLKWLQQERFPHVLIDYQDVHNELTSTVQATNWQGSYDATSYLIELGHRRIGCIVGLQEMQVSLDRLQGYQDALKDHGLDIDPDLIFWGDFFRPEGYKAAQHFLSLADRPTAIVAANDISAFGAMDAVRNAGLHIPSDMSIIGFDDIPEAMHVYPHLTTVRQSMEEMGRVAAQLLFERLEKPDLPGKRVEIPTQLIVRDSTAPAPGN
jgi:LacI family transcriptional regulator